MKNVLLRDFRKQAAAAFGDALTPHGFRLKSKRMSKYSCEIAFVNGERYVKIEANVHPRDFPPYFNVVLGEGSRKWPECDWNAIALWRLKLLATSGRRGSEYSLEHPEKLPRLIDHAKTELMELGVGFLSGDLELFRKVRADQNRDREPYRVYSPGKGGGYTVADDPESVKLKARYS